MSPSPPRTPRLPEITGISDNFDVSESTDTNTANTDTNSTSFDYVRVNVYPDLCKKPCTCREAGENCLLCPGGEFCKADTCQAADQTRFDVETGSTGSEIAVPEGASQSRSKWLTAATIGNICTGLVVMLADTGTLSHS